MRSIYLFLGLLMFLPKQVIGDLVVSGWGSNLVILKESSVEISSQHLQVRPNRIQTDYVLFNNSKDEKNVVIGFPFPLCPSSLGGIEYAADWGGCSTTEDMSVELDGNKLENLKWQIIFYDNNGKSVDVAFYLKKHFSFEFLKPTSLQEFSWLNQDLLGLTNDESKYFTPKKGRDFWKDLNSDLKISQAEYRGLRIKLVKVWEHTFKSNARHTVSHFLNKVGGVTAGDLTPAASRDASALALDFWSRGPNRTPSKAFCFDRKNNKTIERKKCAGPIGQHYILELDADRPGPIKEFELTIHLEDQNLMATCFKGLKRRNHKEYYFKAKSYVPPPAVSVLFSKCQDKKLVGP